MNDTKVLSEPEAREKEWREDLAVKCEQAKAKFFDAINNGEPVPFHPLADAFPFMNDDEILAISESIRTDGLRNPIVIDIDGNIVDGRNRYMAILRLECKVREGYMADTNQSSYPLVNMKAKMDGQIQSIVTVIAPEYRFRNKYAEQIKRFILSENMDRRHLSTSQKAGLAVLVSEQPDSLHKKDITERFAIGGTIYREAKKIKETDEDMFNLVIRGDLTVSEAIKALKGKNDPEEEQKPETLKDLGVVKPEKKPVNDIVDPPVDGETTPEQDQEQEPEKEPDVKPAPEKPQISKEERIKLLLWDKCQFELEESYARAVIKTLQDNEAKIKETVKMLYRGGSLSEKDYEKVYYGIQQTIFNQLFQTKDGCTLDREKTEKVLAEASANP
jgi:hypothetical protein